MGTTTSTMRAAPPLAWEDALDGFRAHCKRRRLRYTTTKAHVSHLRALASLVPAGPADVTPTDVLLWLEERGASKRNAWNSGQVFFAWAVRTGLVTTSPIAPSQRTRRTLRSALLAFPEAWHEPITAYVRTLTSLDRTTRTIEVRLSSLRNLAAVHPHLWTVTYDDLTGWLAVRPDWSPETRKAARSSVIGFYREAVNRGLIETSPAERLGKVRMPRAVPRPAPTDALQLALLEADDRGRLLILLAAYAGLRAHEVAKVHPARDVIEGVLYVTGKGGHQRVVPLHPLITAAVQAELERRREGRYGTGFCGCSIGPTRTAATCSPPRWAGRSPRATSPYSSPRRCRTGGPPTRCATGSLPRRSPRCSTSGRCRSCLGTRRRRRRRATPRSRPGTCSRP